MGEGEGDMVLKESRCKAGQARKGEVAVAGCPVAALERAWFVSRWA